MSVCSPSNRGACCGGVWTASCSVVLRCFAAPLMVACAVLVRSRAHGGACFVAASLPRWLCVVWWCLALVVVVCAAWRPAFLGLGWWCCGGVLAGTMRGLFGLFGVVFAALRSVCTGGCGWQLGCGCGCVACLVGVGCVLVRGPLHGGACWVGVWSPPWWGVLRWFVAPLMVGRAVLVLGPDHGGACCVGVRRPRWWCVVWWCLAWAVVVFWVALAVVLFAWPQLVMCWFLAPPLLGRAVFVRGPPMVGVLCCSAPPPIWWGVLRWFVAPLLVRRAVLVPVCRGGGAWFCGVWLRLSSSVGWVALAVVLFAWPALVLCWCVPPPLLGRAVFLRGQRCRGAWFGGIWLG